MNKPKAIIAKELSDPYNPRYILIDPATYEIVDDAQGYGYKSAQKAYACWSYKNRTTKKKLLIEAEIKGWLQHNQQLFDELKEAALMAVTEDRNIDLEIIVEKYPHPENFKPQDVIKVWLEM